MLLSPNILVAVLVALSFSAIADAQPKRPFQRPNQRPPDKLKEGDAAPDFTLRLMDGNEGETVTLSDYAGKRPVALIFGSYT